MGIIKKDISEKLSNVNRVFPYYSKHDSSHSKTIISNIELFLGEQRLRNLSATDTFMILICAYSHDLGMSLELEEIMDILSDENGKFKDFLDKKYNNDHAELLKSYYNKNRPNGDLKELYYAIIIMLQDYNRPEHWKGVQKIKDEYCSFFQNRIKGRFIKSIIDICMMHGKNIEEIGTLSRYSTGMFADVFHPRFIAAMIRLGDLLDLDNNRFSNEFINSLLKEKSNIPQISKIHYLKHESITHFYIGPNHIDIQASCDGDDALKVARELYEWLNWLEKDCAYLKSEWDLIAQRNFGTAPRLRDKKILVNGLQYQYFDYNLKMELPNDKIFKLLAGSNVYDNRFVAFREIIQNAIDATLLQMWSDFYNGNPLDIQVNDFNKQLAEWCLSNKFESDYNIHINVIEDSKNDCVYFEVIDHGIGIDDEDVYYMSRIGENSICNPQRHKLICEMPDWLVPSGVFGIGLQSAFELTDEIEFFTKKANRTPRHIRFSSYVSNKGRIEVTKCTSSHKDKFDKLLSQGTLVLLKINTKRLNERSKFDYFDFDFDFEQINTHVVRVEIVNQLKKLLNLNSKNYFSITLSDYEINEYGVISYGNSKKVRQKVSSHRELFNILKSGSKFIFRNQKNKSKIILYWSASKNILLTLEIPKCYLEDETNNIVSLCCNEKTFTIRYKYNVINDFSQLFEFHEKEIYSVQNELENNLFDCTVDILDRNTDKYLNIDRNVLKYGALKYSDIVSIECELFTEICKSILDGNDYFLSLEYIPIASILFSRFVNKITMEQFVIKHREKLEKIKIKLESENILLLDLLGYGKKIGVCLDAIDYNEYELLKQNYENIIDGRTLFNIFPKHIFVPVEIKLDHFKNKPYIFYFFQCICRHQNRSCTDSEPHHAAL